MTKGKAEGSRPDTSGLPFHISAMKVNKTD